MNEIVNMFLLAVDKFMSEMHLRQPGFAYNTCKVQRAFASMFHNFFDKNI